MKTTIPIVLLGIIILFSAVFLAGSQSKPFQNFRPAGGGNELVFPKSQKNEEGLVAVTVTPKEISGTSGLTFEISLDTHSVQLDYDLAQLIILIDEKGNVYKPISWQGDPPGGHHRSGILSFPATSASLDSITLKIFEIGGLPERTFTWDLREKGRR